MMIWSEIMKVSDIQCILSISDSEWMHFSTLINRNVKKDLATYMPFLKQNNTIQTISLYSLYPLLFRDIFQMKKNKLDRLILFSHHHFTSLFIIDKIYDSQIIENPMELLVLLEQYSRQVTFLDSLKIRKEKNVLDSINNTFTGLYKEKYVYKHNAILTLDEEKIYAYDKYSFAKIALTVYRTFADDFISDKVFKDLCISHDYFAYGRQILDDIEDFHVDYENKQFNIYTNRYFLKYGVQPFPKFEISLFLELLLESKKYFTEALNILSKKSTYWSRYIDFYLKICNKYLNHFKNIDN